MDIQLTKIQQLANGIVEQYRKVLADEGINASSTLSNTADVVVELNGDMVVISLQLEEYWKYVEYGRRPGKMPPIDNIKEWIKVKPIIPDARTGKIPSAEQLAFLIARKIGREGIPARHPINKTVYTDVTEQIIDAIKAEIVTQLKQQLLD
jgi:hypothetical protein